jgi:hypothetical protein
MTALQAALAAIPGTDLASAKIRGLMRGYDARWSRVQDQYHVIGVEETLTAPLANPTTNRTSRTFTIAGKLDVRAERNGRQVVIDHKTCSEDITDPNAPYWRQLVVEAQPSHYMWLEWLNGRKIDEAVWDVVRKPGISPKGLSKAEVKAALMTGMYCGEPLREDDALLLQTGGRETLAMYEARLAQDCTLDRPDRYFQRRTVVRLDNEMLEYATDLWNDGLEVLNARNAERHGKNAHACMNYGRPCRFLGVCSGHDSADSANWAWKTAVHNELPDLAGDGRDVLTNSRLGVFRTCRRKHYYEYELGIERLDEEEAESLYFGTLWHEACAEWWRCFIGQEAEYGRERTAAIA